MVRNYFKESGLESKSLSSQEKEMALSSFFNREVIASHNKNVYSLGEMLGFEMKDLGIADQKLKNIEPKLVALVSKYEKLWDFNKSKIENSFRNLNQEIEELKSQRRLLRQNRSSKQDINVNQAKLDHLFERKTNGLSKLKLHFRGQIEPAMQSLKMILDSDLLSELVENRFLTKIDKVKELEMKQGESDFRRQRNYDALEDPKNFEYLVADYYEQLFADNDFEVMMTHDYDDKCNGTDFYLKFSDDDNEYMIGVDTTLEIDSSKINEKSQKAKNNLAVDFVYDSEGNKVRNILKTVISPNYDLMDKLSGANLVKYLLLNAYSNKSEIKVALESFSQNELAEIETNGKMFKNYLARVLCDEVTRRIRLVLVNDLHLSTFPEITKGFASYQKFLKFSENHGDKSKKLGELNAMLGRLLEADEMRAAL